MAKNEQATGKTKPPIKDDKAKLDKRKAHVEATKLQAKADKLKMKADELAAKVRAVPDKDKAAPIKLRAEADKAKAEATKAQAAATKAKAAAENLAKQNIPEFDRERLARLHGEFRDAAVAHHTAVERAKDMKKSLDTAQEALNMAVDDITNPPPLLAQMGK